MEVGTQIKKYRSEMGISQEKLAEMVYVSRQTVSNWETGKNYPDIHSLLLLSSLFKVSLDQLIKGDVAIMQQEITEMEIKKLNRYGWIYAGLLLLVVVSLPPLLMWLDWWALAPWGVLLAFTIWFAFQVEKLKRDNAIFTYKEIVAFMNGKRLDEMQRQQELGKRPYQRLLFLLGSTAAGFLVGLLLWRVFPF